MIIASDAEMLWEDHGSPKKFVDWQCAAMYGLQSIRREQSPLCYKSVALNIPP